MHFAALASVPESIADPEEYYRINVGGTKSVLDAMRTAGVRRILFSSTAATYGFHVTMPLREDSAQIPETPYGTTKLTAEWLIKDYARAYGLGYTVLRYFNASGADPDGDFGEDHRHESHLIPLIFQAAVGRRPKILIYGADYPTRDGTCVRDYVHTTDLAQAHQRAVEALEPGMGRAYNLGSGDGVTVLEVLRACEEVIGRPIAHEITDRRPGDPAVLIATPEKIIKELGWSPRYTDIREIVQTAWEWHRRHPHGFRPHRPAELATAHTTMNIAYLTPIYPMPSQTFIRREIAALETHGFTVHRFTLRRFAGKLVDEADLTEQQRTCSILDAGALGLAKAFVLEALRQPRRWIAAVAATVSAGSSLRTGACSGTSSTWRRLASFVAGWRNAAPDTYTPTSAPTPLTLRFCAACLAALLIASRSTDPRNSTPLGRSACGRRSITPPSSSPSASSRAASFIAGATWRTGRKST